MMLAVLRQRNYGLLWIGQMISVFGDYVLLIALPFFIFDLTGSALATGAMFMAANLPRVLLGSVAGVFVDRWDRRRTVIAADLSRAALILILLTVHSVHWLWVVYLVACAQATIAQFFLPAKNAIIPLLVSERELIPANSLNALSENLTRLTAPALGGALFGLFGLVSIVWIDSASFLASGLLIAGIALPAIRRDPAAARGIAWATVWSEWRDGMRLMRADLTITAIFATAGTAMIAEGLFTVLIVPFVKDVLHGSPQDFGWLVSAQAIGGLIGSLFIGRIGKAVRPGILIPVSGFFFGLSDLALATLPSHSGLPPLPVALVAIAFAGAPVVGFFVGIQTLLQASVADAYRGRVFGAYATTVAFMTLIGQGVGSVLGDRLGIVPIFTFAGCFDILAAAVAFVLLRRAAQIAAAAPPARDVAAIVLEN
ncbi:MAG: MFS transporter [Thermomicrobia bacterium]|nr:MFS transporter [Thermomicrobia bacterium]